MLADGLRGFLVGVLLAVVLSALGVPLLLVIVICLLAGFLLGGRL